MNNLDGKTVVELLQICADRGITGMDKQPKEVLIQVILGDMNATGDMPTRDQLESMSLIELRRMCEDRGMEGLGRQTKPTLITLLLNDFVEKTLTGVKATLTVSKNDCDDINTKVQVSCGGNTDDFDVSGYTIEEVIDLLAEVITIPDNPIIIVNGSEVNDSYVLNAGDELELVMPADEKGQN